MFRAFGWMYIEMSNGEKKRARNFAFNAKTYS